LGLRSEPGSTGPSVRCTRGVPRRSGHDPSCPPAGGSC
jgi:hypothetical protein